MEIPSAFTRPETRTVSYLGIAEFCIPASWTDKYARDGDAMYYQEDEPGSCILNLSLQTYQAPGQDDLTPVGILRSVKPQEHAVSLPNGNALAQFERTVSEGGNEFQRSVWIVTGLTKSGIIRIATFIYTIAKSRERDPALMRMRALIDGEIRKARFADNLVEGEV